MRSASVWGGGACAGLVWFGLVRFGSAAEKGKKKVGGGSLVVPFGLEGFGGRKRAKIKKCWRWVFVWFGLVWRGSAAEKGQKLKNVRGG